MGVTIRKVVESSSKEALKLIHMTLHIIRKLLPQSREPINLVTARIRRSQETVKNLQELIDHKSEQLDRQTAKELKNLIQNLIEDNKIVEEQSQKVVKSIRTMEDYLASVEEIQKLLD